MVTYLNTDTAPPPFSNYSQAVEIAPGSRLIAVSGQVGVDLDGNLADTEAGQQEQTWRNILAILKSANMGPDNIVEVTTYITPKSSVAACRKARDRALKGAKPASTLLIISGLADPAWMVEISVVAAG
ncbi:MAG: RidA family protein [Rhizobiales bacterium]|nr:RidA family protein [Hyphomicrobiales bacterium]